MKLLVIIPTYNERENVVPLIHELTQISRINNLNLDILIIDDNSEDGTGEIVEKLKAQNSKLKTILQIIHRPKKLGLGTAYIQGFQYALKNNYDFVFSMDADFSHPVSKIPELYQRAKQGFDIVIGSRYTKGGKIKGWSSFRYLISFLANFFSRLLLSLPPKDVTAGFKCYSKKFLKSLDFSKIKSSGYAFQVEMVKYGKDGGFKISEIPITFLERKKGKSKVSKEIFSSGKSLFLMFISQEGVKQFIRFGLVGGLSMVIDWGIYLLLTRLFLLYYLFSKIISFIISAINNYLLNRSWTFQSREKRIGLQFFKFLVVATCGLLLNAGIMYLLVSILNLFDIYALAIATVVVLFWNFNMNKFWTFR